MVDERAWLGWMIAGLLLVILRVHRSRPPAALAMQGLLLIAALAVGARWRAADPGQFLTGGRLDALTGDHRVVEATLPTTCDGRAIYPTDL